VNINEKWNGRGCARKSRILTRLIPLHPNHLPNRSNDRYFGEYTEGVTCVEVVERIISFGLGGCDLKLGFPWRL
jgi:hypothetical protein